MRILSVSLARCTDSSATFWSACLYRTRWPGVPGARAAGCPAALCGETGARAPGWTARFSPCGRRWEPRTLPACRRSEPGGPAFWCRRCLTDFLTSSLRNAVKNYIWPDSGSLDQPQERTAKFDRVIVRVCLGFLKWTWTSLPIKTRG